ncbi:MAG: exo-alpha-sialidase [Caldilineaceae bacterium]|nr:exo-alpha-sialidase [Caldilineaceae bacterium]
MIRRTLRLGALLCLIAGSLALLPMAASAARNMTSDGANPVYQSGTVPGTVPTSPLPTPTSTTRPVTPPRPTPRPTNPAPPPRPVPPAPNRAAPAENSRGYARIGDDVLLKVIGDRLSPVIYGFTASERVYWSPDDGLLWRYVTTRPEVEDFMMSSADPLTLYSGAGNDCSEEAAEPAPFYYSDSRGKQWDEMAQGAGLTPLVIDPSDALHIFAADCDLPFVSEDGGATWMAQPGDRSSSPWLTARMTVMAATELAGSGDEEGGPAWNALYAAGVTAAGEYILAYSEDGGVTWTAMTPEEGDVPTDVSVLEADPYTAGSLWAADSQGVWMTQDFGASWTLISDGLGRILQGGSANSAAAITDLAYAPATGQLFLAGKRGLYVLPPAADAWEQVKGEAYSLTPLDSLLLTESNPNVLWVNAADGVYRHRIQ